MKILGRGKPFLMGIILTSIVSFSSTSMQASATSAFKACLTASAGPLACLSLIFNPSSGGYLGAGYDRTMGVLLLPWAIASEVVLAPAVIVTGAAAAVEQTCFARASLIDQIEQKIDATLGPDQHLDQKIRKILLNFKKRIKTVKKLIGNHPISHEQLYIFALAGTLYDSRDNRDGLTLADGQTLKLEDISEELPQARKLFEALKQAANKSRRLFQHCKSKDQFVKILITHELDLFKEKLKYEDLLNETKQSLREVLVLAQETLQELHLSKNPV